MDFKLIWALFLKSTTCGCLVREDLPPLQKQKEARVKGHWLPHICQDKQNRSGGWWFVNLHSNE